MIEEQALCRVHRVGQRCNVTTVRYLMRNSFEEVCSRNLRVMHSNSEQHANYSLASC
jgi:hypothetical protein